MRTIKTNVGVVRVNTVARITNGEMTTTIYFIIGHQIKATLYYYGAVFSHGILTIDLPLTVQRQCQLPEQVEHTVNFAPEGFDVYHMMIWFKLAKTDWFKNNKAAKGAMFNYHYNRMTMYIDEPIADYDPSQYEHLPQ